jgi:hypothetical protein
MRVASWKVVVPIAAALGLAPAGTWVVPAQAAEAVVCKLGMASSVKRCRIDVTVVPDSVDSCKMSIPDAEQRELVLGKQSNLRIVWRLNDADGSYLFCRHTGDGVFLKSPVRQGDGQVLNMRVMKNEDDDSADTGDEFACSPRFKWKFKNATGGGFPAGTTYEYNIRVRDAGFIRKCSLDPFIRNG